MKKNGGLRIVEPLITIIHKMKQVFFCGSVSSQLATKDTAQGQRPSLGAWWKPGPSHEKIVMKNHE